MAAVVVEAVGVVAGVLGIAGFVENNLPAQTPKGSTVRVAVGLNGKSGLSGADGDAPSFQAWNENQETIGLSNDGQKIKSGGFVDIFVDQMATGSDHSTEQPTYLQIGAGNDAVCIAYKLAQTWADGTKRGWLGDWGKQCGHDWYASNIVVGNADYMPMCTWMDKDHKPTDVWLGALQIHMDKFVALDNTVPKADPNSFCHPPTQFFSHDYFTNGIVNSKRSFEAQRKPQKPKQRRRRAAVFDNSIIASSHAQHSAKELCDSATSHGPDFVSLVEGVYCDMATKTEYPLCGTEIKDDCYDFNLHKLITGRKMARRDYTNIVHWD